MSQSGGLLSDWRAPASVMLPFSLSRQSLHWKEADHAPRQLFLSPIRKKKCLRSGQQLSEKVLAVVSMNACLSSLCPACSLHPLLTPPEIWHVLRRTPAHPSSFFLIVLPLSVNNPLSASPPTPTHFSKPFRVLLFCLFLCVCKGRVFGGLTALNQTSLLITWQQGTTAHV